MRKKKCGKCVIDLYLCRDFRSDEQIDQFIMNNDDHLADPDIEYDDLQKQNVMAVIEFLSTFNSVTSEPIESITDLTDGVALCEALSEMYVRI